MYGSPRAGGVGRQADGASVCGRDDGDDDDGDMGTCTGDGDDIAEVTKKVAVVIAMTSATR